MHMKFEKDATKDVYFRRNVMFRDILADRPKTTCPRSIDAGHTNNIGHVSLQNHYLSCEQAKQLSCHVNMQNNNLVM